MVSKIIEIFPGFTTTMEESPGGVRIVTTMCNLQNELEPHAFAIAQALYHGGKIMLVIEFPDRSMPVNPPPSKIKGNCELEGDEPYPKTCPVCSLGPCRRDAAPVIARPPLR